MRVTDVRVSVDRTEPDPEPRRDALQSLPGSGSVTVELRTDVGVTGSGTVRFGRIEGAPDVLATLVEAELAPVVTGRSPDFVRGIHEAMLAETEYHGSAGLASFGIAAVDTALWDCLGRAREVPCWQLWGGVREAIPAYSMAGWANYGVARLREAAVEAAEAGFQGVKVKVGDGSLREDVERVEAVLDAVGEDLDVMVDANQVLTTSEAVRRGRAFQELGCAWWEEPIPAHDVDGYAELASALDIPVAAGENLYSKEAFARFLRRGALDLVQPDLRRAGGPTALLQVGSMADAFGVPYAAHAGGPVQLNVMACLPNARYLELAPLEDDSPFELSEGEVSVPRGPGFSWE